MRALFFFTLAILVLIGGVVIETAKWRECLRVHPLWYCVVQK